MDQSRGIRILRLVHPFPSLVNVALVIGLSLLAGASQSRSLLLGLGMLGLQFCIGIVNDLADAELDARTKPWKPVPSGLVSRQAATVAAVASGAGGLLAAASAGPVPLVLAGLMLGAGLLYDLSLKLTPWAWLCFAIAFPLLPVYAWYGAAGTLPPRAELLLPLAALAAPALQLSNGLADFDSDRRGGIATLATRLGRRRAVATMAAILFLLHAIAWVTLAGAPTAAVAVSAGATTLAVAGLGLSAGQDDRRRQAGWTAQAVSLALLGLGWLAAAV